MLSRPDKKTEDIEELIPGVAEDDGGGTVESGDEIPLEEAEDGAAGSGGEAPPEETDDLKPVGQTGTYSLIFQDEFDGTSLDLKKWEPSWFGGSKVSRPVNGEEASCYDPAQVKVTGGKLRLSAATSNHVDCFIRNGTKAKYSSGLINSRKGFLFTYGYIEARIFLSGANGKLHNWPAFWTDGTGTWPVTGEIDVMEGLGSHVPCWHYHYQDANKKHLGPGGCVNMPDSTGWHVFAANWEPGKITFYYDGKKVGEQTVGVVGAQHFIIMNYGLNENYGIHVPSFMEADYVRVWKKQ